MNEIMRLQYLNALGVDQWVANSPLVSARASEFVPLESQNDNQAHQEIVKVATKLQGVEEKQQAQQISPLEQIEKPNNKAPEKSVSYHLQLQGKQGAYVCLVELPSSGLLDNEAQKLLTNIMKSVDQVIALQKISLMRPEVFKWPMFQQQASVSHIDQGQAAAKEAVNAFLFSFMKRNRQSVVIVFGEKIQNLLDASACDKNSVRLIEAPELNALKNNTDLKKMLWREMLGRLG